MAKRKTKKAKEITKDTVVIDMTEDASKEPKPVKKSTKAKPKKTPLPKTLSEDGKQKRLVMPKKVKSVQAEPNRPVVIPTRMKTPKVDLKSAAIDFSKKVLRGFVKLRTSEKR